MAESQQKPWSSNPNAPQISNEMYLEEKIALVGNLSGAVFYGITIVLFFQCIGASFNRARGAIKWGLVAHTTVMFSIVTIYTAIELDLQSIAYIDNREFPGLDGRLPPGPLGYEDLIYSKGKTDVVNIMCLLNGGLADGLLLYRCYFIYSMNFWAIAFPCLVYLASLAIGIVFVYEGSRPDSGIFLSAVINDFGFRYYSISFALNVLLTLMIVGRLFILNRRVRKVMNAPVKLSGLYKTIVTALIESYSLYTVTILLFLGLWAAGNPFAGLFFAALIQVQAIAPFLIILRIANQSGSTNVSIISGNTGSIHFRSRGRLTDCDGVVPDEDSMSSMNIDGGTRVEFDVGIETTVDLHRGG